MAQMGCCTVAPVMPCNARDIVCYTSATDNHRATDHCSVSLSLLTCSVDMCVSLPPVAREQETVTQGDMSRLVPLADISALSAADWLMLLRHAGLHARTDRHKLIYEHTQMQTQTRIGIHTYTVANTHVIYTHTHTHTHPNTTRYTHMDTEANTHSYGYTELHTNTNTHTHTHTQGFRQKYTH